MGTLPEAGCAEVRWWLGVEIGVYVRLPVSFGLWNSIPNFF